MEAGARSKGLCGESLYTMWGQTGKAVQLAQATVEGTRSYQTQDTPQLNSIQFYKQLLIQHSLCLLASRSAWRTQRKSPSPQGATNWVSSRRHQVLEAIKQHPSVMESADQTFWCRVLRELLP